MRPCNYSVSNFLMTSHYFYIKSKILNITYKIFTVWPMLISLTSPPTSLSFKYTKHAPILVPLYFLFSCLLCSYLFMSKILTSVNTLPIFAYPKSTVLTTIFKITKILSTSHYFLSLISFPHSVITVWNFMCLRSYCLFSLSVCLFVLPFPTLNNH